MGWGGVGGGGNFRVSDGQPGGGTGAQETRGARGWEQRKGRRDREEGPRERVEVLSWPQRVGVQAVDWREGGSKAAETKQRGRDGSERKQGGKTRGKEEGVLQPREGDSGGRPGQGRRARAAPGPQVGLTVCEENGDDHPRLHECTGNPEGGIEAAIVRFSMGQEGQGGGRKGGGVR